MLKLLLCLSILLTAGTAEAYIGPGAGIGVLGSLFTWIIGLFVAIFAVLFYPFRWFFRRMKRKLKGSESNSDTENQDEVDSSPTHLDPNSTFETPKKTNSGH